MRTSCARAEAVEVLIRHEPGMTASGGIGGAVDVRLVGGDGDHVVLAVERPAVVEMVEPGLVRVLDLVFASSLMPAVSRR